MRVDGIQESETPKTSVEAGLTKSPYAEAQTALKPAMLPEADQKEDAPPLVSFSFKELAALQTNLQSDELQLYMKLISNNQDKVQDLLYLLTRSGIIYSTDSEKWRQITREITRQLESLAGKQERLLAYFNNQSAYQSFVEINQTILKEWQQLIERIPLLRFGLADKVDFIQNMQDTFQTINRHARMWSDLQGVTEPSPRLEVFIAAKEEANWMTRIIQEFNHIFHARHLMAHELQTENVNIWKLGTAFLKKMNTYLPTMEHFPNPIVHKHYIEATKLLNELYQNLDQLAQGEITQGDIARLLEKMYLQFHRLVGCFQKMELAAGYPEKIDTVDPNEKDITDLMQIAEQEMTLLDLLRKDFGQAVTSPIFYAAIIIFIIIILYSIF